MAKKKHRILVVDDEASMREFLSIMLFRQGYQVDAVSDGGAALAFLTQQPVDLIISDIKMPEMSGLELLSEVKERYSETAMIMVTAFSSAEDAVEAMKQGAYDYITKPFKNDEMLLIIRNALERQNLKKENVELKKELGRRDTFGSLIGKSASMQRVYDLIEKVAPSRASILVTGESGTGKEVVARAIHQGSDRSSGSFVPINCGAIPETLIESELFGHEKGAFTGAVSRKEGLFEVANGGTLFLDEIGELPQLMQVKLLRALQEREVRHVGGNQDIPVDVRIIAATNKDLEQSVRDGAFREDLYYRLNVIQIELPPLRRRSEDILLLAEHFYHRITGKTSCEFDEKALKRFLDYPWPGNVRELENVMERCAVLGADGSITLGCLPQQMTSEGLSAGREMNRIPDEGFSLDDYLAIEERALVQMALEQCRGNRTRAAELLGISFRSIRYRLEKLGIDVDDVDG